LRNTVKKFQKKKRLNRLELDQSSRSLLPHLGNFLKQKAKFIKNSPSNFQQQQNPRFEASLKATSVIQNLLTFSIAQNFQNI